MIKGKKGRSMASLKAGILLKAFLVQGEEKKKGELDRRRTGEKKCEARCARGGSVNSRRLLGKEASKRCPIDRGKKKKKEVLDEGREEKRRSDSRGGAGPFRKALVARGDARRRAGPEIWPKKKKERQAERRRRKSSVGEMLQEGRDWRDRGGGKGEAFGAGTKLCGRAKPKGTRMQSQGRGETTLKTGGGRSRFTLQQRESWRGEPKERGWERGFPKGKKKRGEASPAEGKGRHKTKGEMK